MTPHGMDGIRPLISVVDDDASVRRALRRLVRGAGYGVETFASAHEFLGARGPKRTACVVLDIHLEGMGGFELQRRLAAEGNDTPIIFMTAHDDADTRERVRQAGVAAYLPKPFDKQTLLDAIRGAVGGAAGDGSGEDPEAKSPAPPRVSLTPLD